MDMQLIVKPLLGALIGYSTNWLAIKMLFKPHEAIYLGKIRLPFTPGVIPRERVRLAKSLGKAVGERLLTPEVILNELSNKEVLESMKAYIMTLLSAEGRSVEEIIAISFGDDAPRVEAYLISKLDGFLDQLDLVIDDSKEKIASLLIQELEDEATKEKIGELVSAIILEKVGAFGAMFVEPKGIAQVIVDKGRALLLEENVQVLITDRLIHAKNNLVTGEIVYGMIKKEVLSLSLEEKVLVEKFVETQYLNFVESHLPIFLKQFKIDTIVEKEVNAFEVRTVEHLILDLVKNELSAITWLGAVIGAAMGLIAVVF